MTSTFAAETATVRQSAAAKRRAGFHEARIAAAVPGSRRERMYVLNWLQAEMAHADALDEVLELARAMNGRSS
jgi:hypothetical protein